MKVALVHDFLNQLGGAEKVLLALLELFPEATVYTLIYNPKKTRGIYENYQIKTSYLQKWPISHRFLLAFYPSAVESFNLSQYDLVISSSNSFTKGVITGPQTLHISYVHSPARYLWDWHLEYLEENKIRGIKRAVLAPLLNYLRVWDQTNSHNVDLFLANSQNTQKRIWKYYKLSSQVIYPPVDVPKSPPARHRYAQALAGRPKPYALGPDAYFLIVSRLSEYKKIDLAIEAFAKLKIPLKIVGEGREYQNLKFKIENLKIKNRIELLGYQDDQTVKKIIRESLAVILPGEEDFGLIPVEAAAYGIPTIAYKRGGAQESVVEGVTGEFFKDSNPKSLSEAIKKLLKNRRKYDPVQIWKFSQKFSKEKFKKEILKVVYGSTELTTGENLKSQS